MSPFLFSFLPTPLSPSLSLSNSTPLHSTPLSFLPLLPLLQLPLYPPALFSGPVDGEGLSLLISFSLDPHSSQSLPPHTLSLIQRFISGESEQGGKQDAHAPAVRDRLKLIARLANPGELPLGIAERKLIQAWNQKPVLTRPQHEFYFGDGYMEIDLDVHRYAYVMRKGIQALKTRFHTFEFDVALIVQCNEPELLPEHVLCCIRLHHLDILQMS